MPSTKPPSPWRLVGIGSTIAIMVAGGLLIGWFVDARVDTFPILTMIGLVLGMAAAGYHLYSVFRKFS